MKKLIGSQLLVVVLILSCSSSAWAIIPPTDPCDQEAIQAQYESMALTYGLLVADTWLDAQLENCDDEPSIEGDGGGNGEVFQPVSTTTSSGSGLVIGTPSGGMPMVDKKLPTQ